MDSPMDDEFKRRNAGLLAQELEEEEEEAYLRQNGIPCDGCQELFKFEHLDEVENEFEEVMHICKDC